MLALIGRGEAAVGDADDVGGGGGDAVVEAQNIVNAYTDEAGAVGCVGGVERIHRAKAVDPGETVGVTEPAIDLDPEPPVLSDWLVVGRANLCATNGLVTLLVKFGLLAFHKKWITWL
mgnify:CR=1 FL=1